VFKVQEKEARLDELEAIVNHMFQEGYSVEAMASWSFNISNDRRDIIGNHE